MSGNLKREGRRVSPLRFLGPVFLLAAMALVGACSPAAAPAPTPAPTKASAAAPTTAPAQAATAAPAPAATAAPAPTAATAAPAGSKVTIRLVSPQPKTDELYKVLERWADAVKQKSNGQMEVQLSGVEAIPGGEKDALQGITQLGVFDAVDLSTSILSTVEPKYGLGDLPFIFKDRETGMKVMDGPVGQALDAALLKSTGLRVLMRTGDVFRQMALRTKPINQVADFKGVKVRAIQSDIPLRMFQLLGANPVPISSAEIYTSLQTGIVDAYEAPLASIMSLKTYEVAKHVSLTNHQYVQIVVAMSDKFFQKLTKDQQDLLVSVSKSMLPEHRKLAGDANATARKQLEAQGVKVNDIPDLTPFQNAVAPIYEEFGNKYGYLDLIKQARATQ